MDRYIGIDAHKESCTVAVMGPTGRRIREHRVETDPKVLQDLLRGIRGTKRVCLEEGGLSEWLYEVLEPHVHELVVVQPPKSLGSKNDSIDAWARADELRVGSVRPVFKAPGMYRSLREGVRAHLAVQSDQARTKNRLRAIYRSRGIRGAGEQVYDPIARRPWLALLPDAAQRRARVLSDELDRLVDLVEETEHWLRDEAHRLPVVRRIMTAPGIAEIRAAQIAATVVSPYRFRTSRQFGSYCGLGIVMRSSSDWKQQRDGSWARQQVAQTRGLNRNHHPLLKNVFKGAAHSVLQMSSHPLLDAYQRSLANGTKPNLAQLTVARRIAAAVLAMWKHQEDYDPVRQCAPTSE